MPSKRFCVSVKEIPLLTQQAFTHYVHTWSESGKATLLSAALSLPPTFVRSHDAQLCSLLLLSAVCCT